MEPKALERISEQPRVQKFLSSAAREGRLSHAYLFVGAPGSGMEQAALALAQIAVCPAGGDATCDECIRVAHKTHPDVTWLAPASATGYLIDQIREVLELAALTPVRAKRKVYIVSEAHRLRGAGANALLKTIEEPPDDVMFILLARTTDAVLPTIVSRCQVVPFRTVSSRVAAEHVAAITGATPEEARIALALTGSAEQAAAYLNSSSRRDYRRKILQALSELKHDDGWDVVVVAEELTSLLSSNLKSFSEKKKEEHDKMGDFLSAKALKDLEAATKREVSARERSAIMEMIGCVESVLRDVLARVLQTDAQLINTDYETLVERLAARSDAAGVLDALRACEQATDDVVHNVSPRLVLECMLLSLKEAL